MKTEKDWSKFDAYAISAMNAGIRHSIHLKRCRKKYGNGTVLSGGHCKEWPNEEKSKSRNLLALFYDWQNKAIKAKPPRVHKKTALDRLRTFLE